LLWLQGGPASPSLFAVFNENGPYIVDEELNVSLNKYSWTQEFSMLYIDNPVGTGFSFTDNEKGFSRDQNNIADNLYEALQQFFTLFSEYRNNEFYMSGELYAGKYISAIGYKLHSMRNISNINFKGIVLCNPWIDLSSQLKIEKLIKDLGLKDEKELQDFYYKQNKPLYQVLRDININFSKLKISNSCKITH
jgi:vitellogenic carboxypeptidase-like protein